MAKIQTDEIVKGLLRDSRLGFKDSGEYLREGRCPACDHKELFVRKSMPWRVKCSRENKCGYEASTRELLPELFTNFSKRFRPTKKNPNATADAYLSIDRGFELERIRGWYEQQACQIPGTGKFCPTIRFYMDPERTRYWERLVDQTKQDGQKANFAGKRKPDKSLYRGDAWAPPGQELKDGDPCFIVEGIFHAIALAHTGRKACAAFSCSNFPSNFIEANKGKGIHWVLALDGDKAGKRYMQRHAEKLKSLDEAFDVCLLPDAKNDWDDLYRDRRIKDKFIDWCLYQGRIFMAASVVEKAWHTYRRKRRQKFVLDHDNAIWAIVVDSKFESEAGEQGLDLNDESDMELILEVFKVNISVDRICNVLPHFLYMERDDIMDDQRYVFQVKYKNGPDNLVAWSGNQISTPANFHQALLDTTRGGMFHGTPSNFKQLTRKWMNERMLTVKSIPFTGYDPRTLAYIFQKTAFFNDREIPINDNGYFEIDCTGINTSLQSTAINTHGEFDPAWLPDFVKVFHWQGLATLAWWLGALFAQQIRKKQSSYAFFELTGDAGAGKSTLLEFLWKCVGRDDYEGFDASAASMAGRRRAFNQVSNLPVVLIESDRDGGDPNAKQKQFNFEENKKLYNGRATGTLGIARRNNEVDETLFKGALAISQNAQVDGSDALLGRIVHCHADKNHHSFETRTRARWFESQSSDTVGGFLRQALRNEKRILGIYFKSFEEIEPRFADGGLQVLRVIKCHAQVAAMGRALPVLFPAMETELIEELTEYLYLRAKARETRLKADHPVVAQFWETFDYLNMETKKEEGWLNHAADDDTIAVNLNEYRMACMDYGQELMDFKLLKRLLPESRSHKLVESNKTLWSTKNRKTVRCWVFKK